MPVANPAWSCRNIAGGKSDGSRNTAGDSPAISRDLGAMIGSSSAHGFSGQSANVASPRLIDAVAASLAFGAFSLCLAVVIAALSMKASMAVPL
jgi:hypothetical protein